MKNDTIILKITAKSDYMNDLINVINNITVVEDVEILENLKLLAYN